MAVGFLSTSHPVTPAKAGDERVSLVSIKAHPVVTCTGTSRVKCKIFPMSRKSTGPRVRIRLAFCLALLSSIVNLSGTVARAEDDVVSVPSGDTQMNAAIEKARSGLDGFWNKFANPAANEETFTIKLKLSDGEHDEHFWCDQIQGTKDSATCAIANDPEFVKTVHYGQRIEVDAKLITDWFYVKNGKIMGGQTIRVLLPRLPADQAADLRARLSPE